MAAPTLAQIRSALATNLATIADTQISAYMRAQPTPPTIQIFPEEVRYDEAMRRGMDAWRVTVQAFVGLVADEGSQKRLDVMLAPTGVTSVKAAVESDRTLGGVVDDLRVIECTGYRVYQVAGVQGSVIGAEWTVEILAQGA